MAIYKSDIVDINLETGSIHRSFIKHTIGTADENADRFGVRVFRNGEAVDLSGCSCYGYFQNSNGDNIALTSAGTVDGNVAYITLPQACYNYEGNFCLAIKLLISGVTSTVRIVDGVVDNTNTGSAVTPTDAVPSYSEILDQYDAMVAATAVANGAIATTFNAATVYPAGSYVINSGALYRITADHAANVTWANTSKVATNFGAEVTGLKSALNVLPGMYSDIEYGTSSSDWENKNVAKSGTGAGLASAAANRVVTKNINPIVTGSALKIVTPSGYKHRVLFSVSALGAIPATSFAIVETTGYDDLANWHTEPERVINAPECAGFLVVLAKSDNGNIAPSDIPSGFSIETISIKTQTLAEADEIYVDADDMERNIGYYKRSNIIDGYSWARGIRGPSSLTVNTSSTTRCYLDMIPISSANGKLRLELPSNMKGRMTFGTSSNAYISTTSDTAWTTGTFDFAVPATAAKVGLSVAFADDSTINTSDCSLIKAYQFIGNIPDDGQNAYKLKKISILGDSISTFAGDDAQTAGDGHSIADGTYTYAGNHCRYPNSYLSNANDTYWKKLIDSLGMVLGINDSWAGSRVSWDGGSGSDYGADIYIASPTRIGHLDDNGTPDIILVNAGTNDINPNAHVEVGTFNTESPVNYTDEQIAALPVVTFADAYRALLIRLQKSYPLARIVVMLPNYTTSYYSPTQADQYLEIIKEACDYFGVPWIDMRTTGITMYNTGTYTGDGIHPNIAGMNLLYKKLEKFFVYSL